jgi:predicted transglutaminase-like cysteine proteinase
MIDWPNYRYQEISPGVEGWVKWKLLRDLQGVETLEQANDFVNDRIKYKPDAVDYWQSPDETLKRGAGDCEDFCILKYALLREAGYTDMAMIIGQDVWEPSLQGKRQVHALLFVGTRNYKSSSQAIWERVDVLDNRTPLIHPDTYYHRFFTPWMAVNHKHTWVYLPEKEND